MTVPVVRLLVYLGVGEHVLLLIVARIALHQGERALPKGRRMATLSWVDWAG